MNIWHEEIAENEIFYVSLFLRASKKGKYIFKYKSLIKYKIDQVKREQGSYNVKIM